MQQEWNHYVKQIEQSGKKILASALSTDTPRMQTKTKIWIEVPNDTMKKEIERDQGPLLKHLKTTLNNYEISLHITVNETAEKKYAFTPQEKYEKLREKNPLIDKLRATFDLDI